MKSLKWFVIVVYVCCSVGIFAQNKASVGSKQTDSLSITNLQAVYVGAGISLRTSGRYSFISAGYLNEVKLSSNKSLILSANLLNSIYQKSIFVSNQFVESELVYGVQLSLAAEPRLYFDSSKQHLRLLNTGWFIGLPVELSSSILNSDQILQPSILIAPSVGYRYALSSKFFMECAVGAGIMYKDFQRLDATPYFRLKACYTL